MANRREIFDKRPEDHPAYGEEWRTFWEKRLARYGSYVMCGLLSFSYYRYKELLAQGRDAANHDFKSEWIPYWTKRVAEIFDNEVLEKTDDLMKKYEISSVVEPRRDQFPRSSSSRKHNDENENFSGARRGEEER